MKISKLILIVALSLGLFSTSAHALPTEKPAKYFNDYAHVISQPVVDKLNNDLAQVERDTSNQVVVVVDNNNTSGQPIEDTAIDYARKWGIGQKAKDNGVLFLVFVKDHQMKLEVGNGLQGSLTDIESKQITGSLKPYFRSNNFDGGFQQAVAQIVAKVGREGNKGGGRTVVESQHDQQVAAQQKQSFDHQNASSGGAGLGTVILVILILMGIMAVAFAGLFKKLFGTQQSTNTSTSSDYDETPRRQEYTPTPYTRMTVPTAPYVPPTPVKSSSGVGSFAAGAATGVVADELLSSRRRRRNDDDDDSSRSSSTSSYTPSSYDSSSSSSSSSSSYDSSSSSSDSGSSFSSSDFGGGGGDFSGGGSTDSW